MNKNKELRVRYLSIFIISFLIEVIIFLYVHDKIVRPHVGDGLVVLVVYSFLRIFLPKKGQFMLLYVFLFATLVEVSQYFKLASVLGIENSRLAMATIGSSFDIMDILAYGIGCILIYLIEKKFKTKRSISK